MLALLVKLSRIAFALTLGSSVVFLGIQGVANGSTIAPSARQSGAASVPGLLEANDQTWSPEGLEDLLAPVALYPDEIIGHVLVAATNPQEVLDAGDWRTKHTNLSGTALDAAAKTAGFTPPARLLIQNPIVLDMMCSEFGWTQEVGQAFVNDQAEVLAAIQRLRHQARDAGNLHSSDKMIVDSELVGGQEAITIEAPDSDHVYVPQYDPEKVYVVQHDDDDHHDGVSTTTAVVTSLLSFGGGLALGSLFHHDDHDDHHGDHHDDDWYDDDYYHPVYYGAPMPYYSNYAYRPAYPGYYPATVYAPPPAYPYAHNNYSSYSNTTIINGQSDRYWNRYDDRTYNRRANRPIRSPITEARPNRPELKKLNEEALRGPVRRAPAVEEERANYDVLKKETAARAERRKAAGLERRAPGRDQPGTRGVDRARPLDRPGAAGGGTRAGAPRVEKPVGAVGGSGGGGRVRAESGGAGGGRNRAESGGAGAGGGRNRAESGGAGGAAVTAGGAGGTGARARTGGGGGRNKARAGGAGGDARARPKAAAAGGADQPRPKAEAGGGRRPPPNAGGAGGNKNAGGRRPKPDAGGAGGNKSGGGGGRRRAPQKP